MELARTLLTPNDRIGWLIARSKAAGVPPEALAKKCGISRVGMVNWSKPETDIGQVVRARLEAFAHATHSNVPWILTGEGSPDEPPALSREAHDLARYLESLRYSAPEQYEAIRRIIELTRRPR